MLELRNLPSITYVAVRVIGPYQDTAAGAFRTLMDWAGRSGLLTPASQAIGLAWDDPDEVASDRLRYDAAVTIGKRIDDVPRGFHVGALPALTWAMTMHTGSYSGIPTSFELLSREIDSRDDILRFDFCSLEIYLTGPDTPVADLKTELGIAVVRL